MMKKGCSRCGGNIYVERGCGYTDLACLQCGFRQALDAPKPMALPERRREEYRRPAAA